VAVGLDKIFRVSGLDGGERFALCANGPHLAIKPPDMGHPIGGSLCSNSRRLLLEEGSDEREDVLGDDLIALGCGVGAVALHHAVYSVDSFEKEGEQGDVVFLR
jgi:hypothetical protein